MQLSYTYFDHKIKIVIFVQYKKVRSNEKITINYYFYTSNLC